MAAPRGPAARLSRPSRARVCWLALPALPLLRLAAPPSLGARVAARRGASAEAFVAPWGLARRASTVRVAAGQSPEALLQEAEQLRLEAEAAQALLESKRRLEAAKSVQDAATSEERLQEEASSVAEKLGAARSQLKRAEAFKLPEANTLRLEIEALERRAAQIEGELEAAAAPAPESPPPPEKQVRPPSPEVMDPGIAAAVKAAKAFEDKSKLDGLTEAEWEELARRSTTMNMEERYDLARQLGPEGRRRLDKILETQEAELQEKQKSLEAEERAREEADEKQRVEAAREAARELRGKIDFEKLKAMSNEERLDLAGKLGPAFSASIAIVAVCYWSITLPVLFVAFHETTGAWPKFEDLFNLESAGAVGAVAAVLSVTALLKPLRLLAAFLLTPWTAENVLPVAPWLAGPFQSEPPRGEKPK